jgi:hypothetical protein
MATPNQALRELIGTRAASALTRRKMLVKVEDAHTDVIQYQILPAQPRSGKKLLTDCEMSDAEKMSWRPYSDKNQSIPFICATDFN